MSLRHTLLGILDWTSLHGYALRELAKGYSWIYPMTNANIYPTLRQLENEGFVHHESAVHEGRLRKVYHITDSGREELRRWLGDGTEVQGTYRDPVLLKICLLREGGLADARGWIADELERSREAVENTRRFLQQQENQLPRYTRLVAEHGHDLLKLRSAWFERVLKELEGELGERSAPETESAAG